MTNLIPVALHGIRTLVVVRAFCARATTSDRSMIRFVALGMLLGPVGVVSLHRILNPYQDAVLTASHSGGVVSSLVTLLVLLAPVSFFLFSRRAYLTVSVADAFLLPSESEGLPNVVLEAMSSGVPVVVGKTTLPATIAVDGTAGHVIDANDERAVAGAVIDLLANTDRGRAWGRVGRTLVKPFDIRKVARDHLDIYESMVRSS